MAEEAIKKSSLLGRGRRGYFLVFKKMFFKKVASSATAEAASILVKVTVPYVK